MQVFFTSLQQAGDVFDGAAGRAQRTHDVRAGAVDGLHLDVLLRANTNIRINYPIPRLSTHTQTSYAPKGVSSLFTTATNGHRLPPGGAREKKRLGAPGAPV